MWELENRPHRDRRQADQRPLGRQADQRPLGRGAGATGCTEPRAVLLGPGVPSGARGSARGFALCGRSSASAQRTATTPAAAKALPARAGVRDTSSSTCRSGVGVARRRWSRWPRRCASSARASKRAVSRVVRWPAGDHASGPRTGGTAKGRSRRRRRSVFRRFPRCSGLRARPRVLVALPGSERVAPSQGRGDGHEEMCREGLTRAVAVVCSEHEFGAAQRRHP